MAKQAQSKEESDVGTAKKIMDTNGGAKAKSKQDLQVELIMVKVADAQASTTEEPREGKLHAGICVGGVR